jgi:hypothetical protein
MINPSPVATKARKPIIFNFANNTHLPHWQSFLGTASLYTFYGAYHRKFPYIPFPLGLHLLLKCHISSLFYNPIKHPLAVEYEPTRQGEKIAGFIMVIFIILL